MAAVDADGPLNVAVVEVSGILEDGRLIPSSSIGNNKTWLDQADRIILEVNSWQSPKLEGMHDIYYGTQLPPHRQPIPLVHPNDRIGEAYLRALEAAIATMPAARPPKTRIQIVPGVRCRRWSPTRSGSPICRYSSTRSAIRMNGPAISRRFFCLPSREAVASIG